MIGKLIRPKLIKANAVKGLFFRNNELETEESIKIGNILKGFITQSSSIIKATVLTLSEDCFEISCNCYGTSTSANKDINNCHLLCTWKVKRTFHDSETCLRSVKDLVRDNTFLNLCLSKADIVQLREFIEQLQSMKSLPIVVQDFWTENFYDFVASEDFGQKNSTLSEENFVAKSIFVSTLVISSGVLVAYAVGFLSFIIRVSSLPIQIGILPSLNEKILDAFSLLSHLQTAIKVILLLSAFLATFHRLLGLVVGLYVRNLLGWTQNNGKFDINIDWIALRIGWDKNQILFSGIVWKNPPRFKSTPCFISIKELTVTISSQYVYRALFRQNSAEESIIVIDEVVIDNAHIYIEKTSRKEDGLNLWAAFGAENVEDEKKCSGGLMSFLSSAGNMTVGAFSSTASVGINAVAAGADLGLKAVSATANAGLSAVNATAAAGSAAVSATADVGKMALSTTKDIGSSIGSTLYSTTSFLGIRRKEKAEVIPAVAAPALATPTKVVESNNNNDRDKDDDEDNNLEESPWRDVADAPGFGEEEAAEKKETTLEINRVLLINVNLHVRSEVIYSINYNSIPYYYHCVVFVSMYRRRIFLMPNILKWTAHHL